MWTLLYQSVGQSVPNMFSGRATAGTYFSSNTSPAINPPSCFNVHFCWGLVKEEKVELCDRVGGCTLSCCRTVMRRHVFLLFYPQHLDQLWRPHIFSGFEKRFQSELELKRLWLVIVSVIFDILHNSNKTLQLFFSLHYFKWIIFEFLNCWSDKTSCLRKILCWQTIIRFIGNVNWSLDPVVITFCSQFLK